MEEKVDDSISTESLDEKDFEIYILRDADKRPDVVCCKIADFI